MSAEPVYPRASTFADLLRGYRQARGLTQAEFAARAGVGIRTVRDLERGRARPQRATVELLAGALGLVGQRRHEFGALARRANQPTGVGDQSSPGSALAGPGRRESEPVHRLPLPHPPQLVGRGWELNELDNLLSTADVVTLVGVAGVGKTSLAWATVHRVARRYPAGTAAISVRDVSTEADVLAAAAASFGVSRIGALPAHLSDRPALLLVDGVERAPAAARVALRRLRSEVPALRLLVTGRHAAGIPGEFVWPVTPLDVPPSDGLPLGDTTRFPAVVLFLARLRQVRGGRGPTEGEGAAVGTLVRRLGGLPLALELAAARGRVLSIDEILHRYGDRVLDLGKDDSRVASTLREAVAASYRLLEPPEQYALRRLSVFHGRWSVELAEPLLGEAAGDVVVTLDRLVGLGMVSVRGTGPVKFGLLDVVRDFAGERCAAAGELAQARLDHARIVASYVARLAPGLIGASMPTAVARLDEVASDLRAALTVAAENDPKTALAMAARLPRWWRFRGHDRIGRQWLRQLLSEPRTVSAGPAVRAWAQLGMAQLAAEHGDGIAELPTAEAALATFVRLGDVDGQLAARTLLCVLLQALGGYEAARRHGEAVLALASQYGRTRDVIVAQNNLTWHEIRVGNLAAARRRLIVVQRLARDGGDARLRALAHANLAEVVRLDGRYTDAVAAGRHAIALLADLGDPGHHRRVLGTVALALAQDGQVAEAEAVLTELRRHPSSAGMVRLAEGYLALATADQHAAAVHFGAAADALAGRHDVRDVVESLVGLVVSLNGQRQADARNQLTAVCRRGGVTLLPAERARLIAAGVS